MPGRGEGWNEPSEGGLGCAAVVAAAFLAVGVILVCALCAMSLGDAGADAGAAGRGPVGLAVDVTDAQAMHEAGLPTKSDVLSWHMYGRWGFYELSGGVREVHLWHDLPGGAAVWDALYGLDPDNAAFKYKDGMHGDEA